MLSIRTSFIFAFALAFAGTFADEPERLVNGTPTTIEENPHAVSLRINGKHFCGGSIIDNKHVLTAGHCLHPFKHNHDILNHITIVTGTTYLDKGGEIYKIEKMYVHDQYFDPGIGRPTGFDIALIKLDKSIQFNKHQKAIALPKSNVSKNEPCTVVAWGTTHYKGPIHNNLQKINAKTMLYDECQKRHGSFMRIHKDEFCTFIATGTGACQGDSGSGVVRDSDNTIIGLVSGGRPCAKGYPDVYTSVHPYIPWITKKRAL